MNFIRVVFILAVSLAMSACSGTPGELELTEMLEEKVKSELDSHHNARSVLMPRSSMLAGSVPNNNPTSDSIKLSNLKILEEEVRTNMRGNEVLVLTVSVDADFTVGRFEETQKDRKGVMALVEHNGDYVLSRIQFENFLGFKMFP